MSKLFFFLLLLSSQLFAQGGSGGGHGGGSSVGHGGGVSENNIIAGRKELVAHYQEILSSQEVRITFRERTQLEQIMIRQKTEAKANFKFLRASEYNFGGKVFVASSIPGTDVRFNLDLLYTIQLGQRVPFTFGQSVSLLTEMFQRGDTILSPNETKVLKQKIENYFEQSSTTLTLTSWGRPGLQFSTINWDQRSEVFLMDDESLKNVTKFVEQNLPCETKAKLVRLTNLHLGTQLPVDQNQQRVSYRATVEFQCGETSLEGLMILKTVYQLKGQQAITGNWWSNGAVSAHILLPQLRIAFEDIH